MGHDAAHKLPSNWPIRGLIVHSNVHTAGADWPN